MSESAPKRRRLEGITLRHGRGCAAAHAAAAPAAPPSRPRSFPRATGPLRGVYEWPSRDLRDGIPFPQPLCEPPTSGRRVYERFPVTRRRAGPGLRSRSRCTYTPSPKLSTERCVTGGAKSGRWRPARVLPQEPRDARVSSMSRSAMPDRRRTRSSRCDLASMLCSGRASLRRREVCVIRSCDPDELRRHPGPRRRTAVVPRMAEQTAWVVHCAGSGGSRATASETIVEVARQN